MADGPRGLQGKQGIEGKQGPRGKDGRQGLRGPAGLDGKDGADGTSVEVDNVLPQDVGSAAVVGSSLKASPSNHVHKGVRSIKKDGSGQLFGNVTLSEGANITLTQVGNDIEIAATGGGGGGTPPDEVTIVTDSSVLKRAALTGDVTSSLGSNATAIDADAVNAKVGHDYDSWFHDQVAIMKAQVPALTNFKEVQRPGEYSLADLYSVATFANFASTYEGGGHSGPNNTYHVLGTPVFQTMKTGKWAFAFRAKMPAPSVGTFHWFGAMSLGTINSLIGVSSYNTMSATKWVLYTWENPTEIGVATSTSADANLHDFLMTFDGTTIKLYVDGNLEATQTTLTQVTDGPRSLGMYSSTHGDTHVLRVAYGYIAP